MAKLTDIYKMETAQPVAGKPKKKEAVPAAPLIVGKYNLATARPVGMPSPPEVVPSATPQPAAPGTTHSQLYAKNVVYPLANAPWELAEGGARTIMQAGQAATAPADIQRRARAQSAETDIKRDEMRIAALRAGKDLEAVPVPKLSDVLPGGQDRYKKRLDEHRAAKTTVDKESSAARISELEARVKQNRSILEEEKNRVTLFDTFKEAEQQIIKNPTIMKRLNEARRGENQQIMEGASGLERGIYAGAETVQGLAISLPMMKAFTGMLPYGSVMKGGTWEDVADHTIKHAGKLAVFTYVRTPGTPEEKMDAALTTFKYMATPALSSGMPTRPLAFIVDTLLNSGVSFESGAFSDASEMAREMAEQAGKPDQWRKYLPQTLTPVMLTDLLFSIATKPAMDAAYRAPEFGTSVAEVSRWMKATFPNQNTMSDSQRMSAVADIQPLMDRLNSGEYGEEGKEYRRALMRLKNAERHYEIDATKEGRKREAFKTLVSARERANEAEARFNARHPEMAAKVSLQQARPQAPDIAIPGEGAPRPDAQIARPGEVQPRPDAQIIPPATTGAGDRAMVEVGPIGLGQRQQEARFGAVGRTMPAERTTEAILSDLEASGEAERVSQQDLVNMGLSEEEARAYLMNRIQNGKPTNISGIGQKGLVAQEPSETAPAQAEPIPPAPAVQSPAPAPEPPQAGIQAPPAPEAVKEPLAARPETVTPPIEKGGVSIFTNDETGEQITGTVLRETAKSVVVQDENGKKRTLTKDQWAGETAEPVVKESLKTEPGTVAENARVAGPVVAKSATTENSQTGSMVPIKKRDMQRIIKRMESGDLKQVGLKSEKTKNNRGDYGYDETFYYNGNPVLRISIDGARRDVRFSADESALESIVNNPPPVVTDTAKGDLSKRLAKLSDNQVAQVAVNVGIRSLTWTRESIIAEADADALTRAIELEEGQYKPKVTETKKGAKVEVPMSEKKADALTPKEQKKYLIQEIDAAIENAPDAGQMTKDNARVTIEVPGDGTFVVKNGKESLEAFKKSVSRKFPVSNEPTIPSTPDKKNVNKDADNAIDLYGSAKKAAEKVRSQIETMSDGATEQQIKGWNDLAYELEKRADLTDDPKDQKTARLERIRELVKQREYAVEKSAEMRRAKEREGKALSALKDHPLYKKTRAQIAENYRSRGMKNRADDMDADILNADVSGRGAPEIRKAQEQIAKDLGIRQVKGNRGRISYPLENYWKDIAESKVDAEQPAPQDIEGEGKKAKPLKGVTSKANMLIDNIERLAREDLDQLKRGGTMGMNKPLGMAVDYTIIGATKIARGVVKFSEWSAEMVKEFGEGIRPYLSKIYDKARSIDLSKYDTQEALIAEAKRIGSTLKIDEESMKVTDRRASAVIKDAVKAANEDSAAKTPEEAVRKTVAAESDKNNSPSAIASEAQKLRDEIERRGAISMPTASDVARLARRATERVTGHMRLFGEQYSSDKPLQKKLEKAFHETAAAVEAGISEVDSALRAAGNRSQADSLSVVFALEERGGGRGSVPPSAQNLFDAAKDTVDRVTRLEQMAGTLRDGFPDGTRRRINDEITRLSAGRQGPSTVKKISELRADLAALDKFAGYLPHGVVARRVMENIFENSPRRVRRGYADRLQQFHHQRTGRSTLREYLDAGVIRPEDIDVGKLLMEMSVNAYRRVAIKRLVDGATADGHIVFSEDMPAGERGEWFRLSDLASSARVYNIQAPDGQKVWVSRLFGLGLEELAGANNKQNLAIDKVLSIAKVGQFYNPRIIWSYNFMQRIYGGAVEWNPFKDAKNTADAWRSVMTTDDNYKLADRLGIFQTPDNIARATVDKQIALVSRRTVDGITRGGWAGDQFQKIVERALGEEMTPRAWANKTVAQALTDTLLLPLRPISNVTWLGDRVQRMHTFNNLTRRGMSPEHAADVTARMHGAYSLLGKEYKAWASRIFFVHSFRLLMPLQTVRAYTTPVSLAIKAATGKTIEKGEAKRAMAALIGTIAFPTMLDSALRAMGWTNSEEEDDLFKKGPLKYLRVPVGDSGYRVTLALPNWKYKREFMFNGEKREVVLGVNNIVNMGTKWLVRSRGKEIISPGIEDLPSWTLLKWEVNPLYRTAIDVFENESSFGYAPPRGADGQDWSAAVGYLFGNIIKLYGDAYRMMADDSGSDVYKERQRAELDEALSFGEKVLGKIFGYSYTRSEKEKRARQYIGSLRRSLSSARGNAEKHYRGDRLKEELESLDRLADKYEARIRDRFGLPEVDPPKKKRVKSGGARL